MDMLKKGNGTITSYADTCFYTVSPANGQKSLSMLKLAGWFIVLSVIGHVSMLLSLIVFAALLFIGVRGTPASTGVLKDVTDSGLAA